VFEAMVKRLRWGVGRSALILSYTGQEEPSVAVAPEPVSPPPGDDEAPVSDEFTTSEQIPTVSGDEINIPATVEPHTPGPKAADAGRAADILSRSVDCQTQDRPEVHESTR
jgi:hypothetical protein